MKTRVWDDDAITYVNGKPVRGAFVEYELLWNGRGCTPQERLDADYWASRCGGLQRTHPDEGAEKRDRSNLPSVYDGKGKGGHDASWRLTSLKPETIRYIAAELQKGRTVTALANVCKCSVKVVVRVKTALEQKRAAL